MTPNPIQTKLGKDLVIWDLGNLKSWSLNLVEAHEEARRTVKQIRETRAKIISLGGGHDWAYPDLIDSKDRLINVDAHLDMRPLVNDPDASSHSGTPFRKILTQRHDASNLSILGLQKHCNARAHVEFAKSHRASMVFLEELPWNLEKQWVMINEKFGLESDRDRFALSIDLDAFPQSIAPGVSAPQTLGLDPQLVMRLIDALGPRLRQLGVYELNPLFDRDGETARLAAKLIYKFMTSEG